MTCPHCGHAEAEGRFCSECGGALAETCSACQAPLPSGAKFCSECGIGVGAPPTPTGRGSTPDAGERRQLTVLFCDLVGSTPLSQRLDPEDWRDVVTRYHATARAAVERFGGHVAQLLGDGLLVYFGWPAAREDDPERAIRAGLAIVEAAAALDTELTLPNGMRLAVRVGMHTGAVVVAASGAIFGETANIAARVQGAADPDTVVITAATQRLVAGMFVLEERGAHELKGVREPIVLYRVVRPSGVRSRLDVAAGRLTRFVGRDVELATLVERFERTDDGEGQTALIVGEAGVGKSRLAYELRERLAPIPHTWLECGASPYTESTPFHPVIALVAQGLAFTGEDSATDKIDKITRALTGAGLPSEESVALVAEFLGLDPPTPLAMAPEVRRQRTIELLVAWNLALSETQALVVLVEDLHWCDPSSLELLGRLVAQSATARVLLIGTARPEFAPPWGARSNLTTIQVSRLTKRQARAMAAALGAGALSEAMVDTLVERADGIPLFLEELTKAVTEAGSAGGVAAIPPTLTDSLMARLDRLSSAKEVAQRAAVLGREFSYELLAAVGGMEEPALRQGLTRLVDSEILYARGEPPHATYVFKHALVQQAAYDALLKRTRQQLHGHVVAVLHARFPERAAAEPEVVARHAEAAGRSEDATASYGLAGDHAQARWAHEEALGHFRKAIALLATLAPGADRDDRELTLQLALGASLVAVRGFAHVETAVVCERAVALAETVHDAARLDVARTGLGNFYSNRGEFGRARALHAEVLTAAETRGDSQHVLNSHADLGLLDHYEGKFASSLAHLEHVVSSAEPMRDGGLMRMTGVDAGVVARMVSAWDLWHVGRSDAALVRAQESVDLARRLAHPFSEATALFGQSVTRCVRRDSAAQLACAAEAIAVSEAYGFWFFLEMARLLHGAARVATGEREALAAMLEATARAAEPGGRGGATFFFLVVAEAQRAAGDPIAARNTLEVGLALAAETGELAWAADFDRLGGDLVLAMGGSADEATARYERALATARAQGSRALELRTATSFARLRRDQGTRAEARALLAPVYATFIEGFDTRDLVAAQALLDELS